MKNHLCANGWLLTLTVALCCVLYPAIVWTYAHYLFPESAAGSLVTGKDADGKEVVKGSRLIAQAFSKDWYFQPRPSAAAYNATASSGTNWGPNNPKLRDRVARATGNFTVQYDAQKSPTTGSVQKDIEAWFTSQPHDLDKPEDALMVKWSGDYSTLASAWVKSDDNRPAVIEWLRQHPDILEDWRKSKENPPEVDLNDKDTIPFDDLVTPFFTSVAKTKEFKNRWPEPEEFDTGAKDDKGEAVKGKRFKPVTEGKDLQATFFDLWLQAHPDVALVKVPADMVTASGSGLDPHITLRNADYQMDSVVKARADATKKSPGEVRTLVQRIVKRHTFTPLSGLIGEPLVNVFEVNWEMDKEIPIPPAPAEAPKSP